MIGTADGEHFISSDMAAVIEHTRNMYVLEDGDMAVLTRNDVSIRKVKTGEEIQRPVFRVDWNLEQAEKNGYDHFMLKEIHEQPAALKKTMAGHIDEQSNTVRLDQLRWSDRDVRRWDKIFIVACGTAYHAGLIGKRVLEEWTRIPVEVDVASEFRYRRPILSENTLVIVVSQSGETADTLAALRESRRRGRKCWRSPMWSAVRSPGKRIR